MIFFLIFTGLGVGALLEGNLLGILLIILGLSCFLPSQDTRGDLGKTARYWNC
jgi:hypothetical protein